MVRSLLAHVQPRPLLLVLAAVFTGLAVVLVVAASVTATPLALMAAAPLLVTGVLMWYQGTGRLPKIGFGAPRRRGRRRRARAGTRSTVGGGPGASRTSDQRTGDGGDDAWRAAFREEAAREARNRARRQARRQARREARNDAGGRTGAGAGSYGTWEPSWGPDGHAGDATRAEAYEVLGLDPSASDDEVREAYREKAKHEHPDTEGGSAEAFQELNEAYERLIDE